jgi:hypothetical protein
MPTESSISKQIRVRGLKVTTLVPPAELVGLVPPEPEPAGTPAIDLIIEGSPLVVRAGLNGKGVRRALKVIAEHGAENVNVLLQGNLIGGPTADGPFLLDSAGITATPKVPKPASPT